MKRNPLLYNTQVIAFLILSTFIVIACNSRKNNRDQNSEVSKVSTIHKVNVYYFHFARRCATCIAVEKESQRAVKELFGDKVSFTSYNLDWPDGEKLGKQLSIFGQTLLIVCGDKKIELTAKGFRYARKNPEKLKQILKEKIEPLL